MITRSRRPIDLVWKLSALALFIIGLAGVPDDVEQWLIWFNLVWAFLVTTELSWLLMLVGAAMLVPGSLQAIVKMSDKILTAVGIQGNVTRLYVQDDMLSDISSLLEELESSLHMAITDDNVELSLRHYLPANVRSRMHGLKERFRYQHVMCPPIELSFRDVEEWIAFLSQNKVAIQSGQSLVGYVDNSS